MNSTRIEIIRKDIAHLAVKIISVFIIFMTVINLDAFSPFRAATVVGLVLNILAIAVWTARELVVIDFDKNVIQEGTRIMGISQMDTYAFSGFEKIFINKIKTKVDLRHLTTTTTVHDEQYRSFIKTHEGDKICIGIDKDKDRLINKLRRLNERLNVPILDNTGSEPVQIDSSK